MSFNPKLFQHLLDVLFYAVGRVIFFILNFMQLVVFYFSSKNFFVYIFYVLMHCECEAHFLQYLSLMSVHIIILPSLLYIPPPPASLYNLRPFSSPS